MRLIPDINDAAIKRPKLKGALVQLILFSTLIIAFRFPGIRFNDWRLNDLCGGLIVIWMPVTLIRLALAVQSRLIRYVTMVIGIVLFVFILFGSFLNFIEIGNESKGFSKNDPNFRREWEIGSAQYRLYIDEGGFGQPPSGYLRREWGTAYGVKFVQPIFGTVYYCCDIELRQPKGSTAEFVEGTSGSVLAEINTSNGSFLVKVDR